MTAIEELRTSIKKGDMLSLTRFFVVESVSSDHTSLHARDVYSGQQFDVIGVDLIDDMSHADNYLEERQATKTELAELLTAARNVPFTVNFNKVDGTQRTLRGRLLSSQGLLGYSLVEDLDKPDGDKRDNLRQVNHRAINWLICDGFKYSLKGS